VVRIRRLQRERRVFSVNANNKVVEYEIRYRLAYRLEQPPGTTVVTPEPLLARRIIYEPGGELLGRVREAELREQDVYADLARRLIRQLASR
jgi:outer membrane lipopolysaccharide assembly protein LptE/RlpB